MSGAVRAYLLSLTAAAMLGATLMALTPKGGARRAVRLGCGLLMLLCALAPLKRFDAAEISRMLSSIEMQQDAAASGVEVKNRELVCAIISGKAEAYILDKARALGLTITVRVEAKDDGAGPYLSSVTYTGSAEKQKREALTEDVERTLAIPKERQMWYSE